jgi:hypothetical protein
MTNDFMQLYAFLPGFRGAAISPDRLSTSVHSDNQFFTIRSWRIGEKIKTQFPIPRYLIISSPPTWEYSDPCEFNFKGVAPRKI